jgi:hypothetical protein
MGYNARNWEYFDDLRNHLIFARIDKGRNRREIAVFELLVKNAMKTNLSKAVAVFIIGAAAGLPALSQAQDSNSAYTSAPASSTVAPAPALPYGVSQILQLAQAKVGDETIIAFIRNSGNSYGLNADQIIYLQQQGLSSPVITAMLNQPRAGVMSGTVATPTPAPAVTQTAESYSQQPAATYNAVTPAVTAIDPAYTYYSYSPYYYPTYAYPYYYYPYGVYPSVSLSFGWGWGGRGWGGGWHGGGWHGGGGWGGHGGWHR